MEALAKHKDMPQGLKITNKTCRLLYDAAWIAGVEYDGDEFEEDLEEDASDYLDEDDDIKDKDYERMDPNEIEGLADPEEFQNDDDEENS